MDMKIMHEFVREKCFQSLYNTIISVYLNIFFDYKYV